MFIVQGINVEQIFCNVIFVTVAKGKKKHRKIPKMDKEVKHFTVIFLLCTMRDGHFLMPAYCENTKKSQPSSNRYNIKEMEKKM